MKVLEALSVYAEHKTILENISLDIEEGDRLAIIGPSASGKSTLLKVLAGVLDTEQFRIEGRIQNPVRRYGMIFQEPKACLNPIRSVEASFYSLNKIPSVPRIDAARIKKYLSLVKLPTEKTFLKLLPHQLSGGMAQRVMVALILACDYTWILADEVSSSLDKEHENSLLSLLHEHASTVLMVTHRIYLLKRFCNKVLYLDKGRQEYYGSVDDMYLSKEVQSFVGSSLQKNLDHDSHERETKAE